MASVIRGRSQNRGELPRVLPGGKLVNVKSLRSPHGYSN